MLSKFIRLLAQFALILLICLFTVAYWTATTGCQSPGAQQRQQTSLHWFTNNGKVKALATTAMVADLVNAIGGDYIDTFTLITGELDPHCYQLVKGDDEKFSYAHLLFYNGLGLEHGPSLMTRLRADAKAVGLGNYILSQEKQAATSGKYSTERKEPKLLFYHGQPDPHIWMDLSLWSEAIPAIAAALGSYDPEHATYYKQRAEQTRDELLAAHKQVQAILAAVPAARRYLITSHDAFNYFTRAYLASEEELASNSWQERFHAPEGLAPDSQISTAQIRLTLDFLKKHSIQTLFSESNVNKDSLRKVIDVASQQGLAISLATKPLYSDSMGTKGTEAATLIGMIQYNAKTIAQHLQ